MANPKTPLRTAPLGDRLEPAIDRLRAIATRSYDNLLLADGPPDPDYLLLDLCSDALHAVKQHNKLDDERSAVEPRTSGEWSNKDRTAYMALCDRQREWDSEIARLLRRAAKLKATTPAGIYAKALLVRSSKTGAAVLAMSLAEELVECEGLRASLWPAREPAA